MKNSIILFFGTLVALLSVSCTERSGVTLVEALDSQAWENSVWISAADAPVVTCTIRDGERAADGASWFVSEVNPSKKVTSAKWMTTALGVCQLYVNGELIGKEILKPGFTHFEKTRISYTYDITGLLEDTNVLAAQATPGWWADKIITPLGQTGMNGRKCAFRSVLELTYSDGTVECFGTDTLHWKAGIAGPVKHAAI